MSFLAVVRRPRERLSIQRRLEALLLCKSENNELCIGQIVLYSSPIPNKITSDERGQDMHPKGDISEVDGGWRENNLINAVIIVHNINMIGN